MFGILSPAQRLEGTLASINRHTPFLTEAQKAQLLPSLAERIATERVRSATAERFAPCLRSQRRFAEELPHIREGLKLSGFMLVVWFVVLVACGLGLWLDDNDELRAERATQLSKQDAIAAECCMKERP